MHIERMFDGIAPNYDRLNRVLSLGLDRGWRRAAIRALKRHAPRHVLDIACGSGDLALAALEAGADRVTAADPSVRMLELAAAKAAKRGLAPGIALLRAAAEDLPCADSSFDAVTVGFGLRNFTDIDKGLAEMRRVLKPGGVAVILEFSRPGHFPVRTLHRLYLKRVIPLLGRLLAGDRAAYAYLGGSILGFPDGEGLMAILRRAGFSRLECRRLTLGVCSVYTAVR
jgi:demethylmenaquinone methyltransferase/2-methoxy-6-polyprenyl-1,4-benzoquinol methylase